MYIFYFYTMCDTCANRKIGREWFGSFFSFSSIIVAIYVSFLLYRLNELKLMSIGAALIEKIVFFCCCDNPFLWMKTIWKGFLIPFFALFWANFFLYTHLSIEMCNFIRMNLERKDGNSLLCESHSAHFLIFCFSLALHGC